MTLRGDEWLGLHLPPSCDRMCFHNISTVQIIWSSYCLIEQIKYAVCFHEASSFKPTKFLFFFAFAFLSWLELSLQIPQKGSMGDPGWKPITSWRKRLFIDVCACQAEGAVQTMVQAGLGALLWPNCSAVLADRTKHVLTACRAAFTALPVSERDELCRSVWSRAGGWNFNKGLRVKRGKGKGVKSPAGWDPCQPPLLRLWQPAGSTQTPKNAQEEQRWEDLQAR